MWLPERRILFSGDLFGPLFPMWPNLYTIRGEPIRLALPYVASLERVLALEPEIVVPSHFEPIRGAERIRADVTRMRDAVVYVHDAVVTGMNDGQSLETLMQEIRLPESLALTEAHGKVSWSVRAIWERHAGWFRYGSSTELYGVPVAGIYPEIVEMALAVDAAHPGALEARLDALRLLLQRSGDVNHGEVFWLRDRIERTKAQLEQ